MTGCAARGGLPSGSRCLVSPKSTIFWVGLASKRAVMSFTFSGCATHGTDEVPVSIDPVGTPCVERESGMSTTRSGERAVT